MSEVFAAQFWLAELDKYGTGQLIDGPHSDRGGAEQAMTLFKKLGFVRDRKFAVAEVRLSAFTGEHPPVNEEAIKALNEFGLS